MMEVELKASLRQAQVDEIIATLEKLGFEKGPLRHESDAYYNAPHRDFRKTDEALRLRSVDDQTLLTYKGPKTDNRSNARTEFETAVADANTAAALLDALGFQPAYTVDKARRMYTRGAVTVCMDRVRGLGDFMELETLLDDESGRDAAVDMLMELLQQLGVDPNALSRKSYLELLIASATL